MDKNIYCKLNALKGLMILCCISVFFNACKKNSDAVNPGISYGITGIIPAMAGTGDTIKVYGIGFVASIEGNVIKINGADAKIISATTTELSVIVPNAPRTGAVLVKTGSKSFTYNQSFSVATVISGDQPTSTTWSANNLYLLKGAVHFLKGAVLTIPAGTTIEADKTTNASLTIDDGATVLMNGTADQPVVFTSNQAINFRSPGDWRGIILAASASTGTSDVLNYVRIEFAGFHVSNIPGAALLLNRSIGNKNVDYVQVSYSAGDGFRSAGGAGTLQYLKHLVAFGCAGNDFDIDGSTKVIGQFLLGLKDPLYADQLGSDGLRIQSSKPVTISNLTLMGPNGLARNTIINQPSYNFGKNFDDILNTNAGSGVRIGGYDFASGGVLNGTLQLYNSLVAAPWQAGIAIEGTQAWANYANGAGSSMIKYSFVTYTLANSFNTFNHYTPPLHGYTFSSDNLSSAVSGFESADNTPQYASFTKYNDSVTLQLVTPFLSAINPNQTYDDLGVANLAQYKRLSNPLMTPASGSRLLLGAIFSDGQLADTFFDKTNTFRGAFGTTDWTKLWSNYVPQLTSYN